MDRFGKAIEVGDGSSAKRSKEIFKQSFKEAKSDEVVALHKKHDQDRWKEQNKKHILYKPHLLEPVPEGRDGHGVFMVKHSERITFKCGLWAVVLTLTDEAGKRFKHPVWTLAVRVGRQFKCSPSGIRKQILDQFDEKTYFQWRQLVMTNKEGAYETLASACDWLGQKKKVGLNYISGGSSVRLLRELGILCETHYAFLYPHYKTMLEEKLLKDNRSEFEEWIETDSRQDADQFFEMVANLKKQNPKLSDQQARDQMIELLHGMSRFGQHGQG